jgi:D-xylose 1-dehydrogenase (NADP+, D-xylono-1,5-lactone-forming)
MALRVGVLGAANIARKTVIPAILRADGVELVAVGSSSDRAREFLAQSRLEGVRACTYDELLLAEDVDAVYIPLPNDLHAPWSKRAADAGKHVLCEKPAARTRDEAADAITYCEQRGVIWMEAFMYRFHPQWQVVFQRLAGIGELRHVHATFTFTVSDPENVRRNPDGGGSLYDVGYYCVNVVRWLFGCEPQAVSAAQHLGPEGVDEEFAGLLEFGSGRTGSIVSSFTQPYRHEVELLGSAGRIRVPRAFVNGLDPVAVEVQDAAGAWEIVESAGDEYRLEVEDFARCVAENRQPTVVSHADTLDNMAAIDALYEAARGGKTVRL